MSEYGGLTRKEAIWEIPFHVGIRHQRAMLEARGKDVRDRTDDPFAIARRHDQLIGG